LKKWHIEKLRINVKLGFSQGLVWEQSAAGVAKDAMADVIVDLREQHGARVLSPLSSIRHAASLELGLSDATMTCGKNNLPSSM